MSERQKDGDGEVALSEAAAALGLTYRQAFDAVLTRRLMGRRLPNGRWRVQVASIAAYQAQRERQSAECSASGSAPAA